MKKIFLAVLLIVTGNLTAQAQRISRVSSGVDIGSGFGDNGQFSPSLLYYQNLQPPHLRWAQLSGGVRIWNYHGRDTNLTAPGGFSREDVMSLDRVSATGISFFMGVNFQPIRFLDIGANADLLSLALGKRRSALYTLAMPGGSDDSLTLALNGENVDIAPTNLNAVPAFLKRNNGQAEAYVRIWFGRQIGLKLGYMIGQISYRTDQKLNGQGRFSSMYQMPYAAISIPLNY